MPGRSVNLVLFDLLFLDDESDVEQQDHKSADTADDAFGVVELGNDEKLLRKVQDQEEEETLADAGKRFDLFCFHRLHSSIKM